MALRRQPDQRAAADGLLLPPVPAGDSIAGPAEPQAVSPTACRRSTARSRRPACRGSGCPKSTSARCELIALFLTPVYVYLFFALVRPERAGAGRAGRGRRPPGCCGGGWPAGPDARLRQIKRRMPFLLDLLTLLMEAGSTFLDALRQAVEEFQGHPVAEEFGRVLADMNLGKTRTEAFQAMRDRLADDEITSIIGSILQGETLGTPLANIFRTQADVLRIKRTQRAETGGRRGGREHAPARRAGHGRHRADHHRPVPALESTCNLSDVAQSADRPNEQMAIKTRLPPLQDAACRCPASWPAATCNCPHCKGRLWVAKDAPADATPVEAVPCVGRRRSPRARRRDRRRRRRRSAACRRDAAIASPDAPGASPSPAAVAPPARPAVVGDGAGAAGRTAADARRSPASSPPRRPTRRCSWPPTASCPNLRLEEGGGRAEAGSRSQIDQSPGPAGRAEHERGAFGRAGAARRGRRRPPRRPQRKDAMRQMIESEYFGAGNIESKELGTLSGAPPRGPAGPQPRRLSRPSARITARCWTCSAPNAAADEKGLTGSRTRQELEEAISALRRRALSRSSLQCDG